LAESRREKFFFGTGHDEEMPRCIEEPPDSNSSEPGGSNPIADA
jgi:hypothetical protein